MVEGGEADVEGGGEADVEGKEREEYGGGGDEGRVENDLGGGGEEVEQDWRAGVVDCDKK